MIEDNEGLRFIPGELGYGGHCPRVLLAQLFPLLIRTSRDVEQQFYAGNALP